MDKTIERNAQYWSKKHGQYLILPDDGLELLNPDEEQILIALFAPQYCKKYEALACPVIRKSCPGTLFFEKLDILCETHYDYVLNVVDINTDMINKSFSSDLLQSLNQTLTNFGVTVDPV